MTIDTGLASIMAFVVGGCFGWWRATVHARKLRHFEIDLDDWAGYDEQKRQAHGQRGNITGFRR